ncbi:hypothetical protein ACOME3_006138 [Neoechinorhynchus agilis]
MCPMTCFTALVESEALKLANDFKSLCETQFPTKQIANNMFNELRKISGSSDILLQITTCKHVLTSFLIAIGEFCPTKEQTRKSNCLPRSFDLLTHGFGTKAVSASVGAVDKCLDEIMEQFGTNKF